MVPTNLSDDVREFVRKSPAYECVLHIKYRYDPLVDELRVYREDNHFIVAKEDKFGRKETYGYKFGRNDDMSDVVEKLESPSIPTRASEISCVKVDSMGLLSRLEERQVERRVEIKQRLS